MVIKGLNDVKLELSTDEAIQLIATLSAGIIHANKYKSSVQFWKFGFAREVDEEKFQPGVLALEIIRED